MKSDRNLFYTENMHLLEIRKVTYSYLLLLDSEAHQYHIFR